MNRAVALSSGFQLGSNCLVLEFETEKKNGSSAEILDGRRGEDGPDVDWTGSTRTAYLFIYLCLLNSLP